MRSLFKESEKNLALLGIGITVLLVIFIYFTHSLLRLIFHHPLSYDTGDFIFRMMIWLFLGAIYLSATKFEKQPFLLWPEKPYTADFYIVSIVVLWVINYFIGGLISIPFTHGYNINFIHKLKVMQHASKPVKFIGVVTAGFCEELIFRGYLIPRLQLYFKDIRYPIIISALLFSLSHLGYQTMYYVFYTLAFGILAGYFYYKYRNIKILIIAHFLLDYYLLVLTA